MTATIDCPIGLFPQQDTEIARLTRAINQAPTARQKAPLAEELLEAVDVLLRCEVFDTTQNACHLCRNISQLRHKTAALVVRAGQLSR